jgi:ParB-like chromosome segregation protein Spo0J
MSPSQPENVSMPARASEPATMTRVIRAGVEAIPLEEVDLRFASLRLFYPAQLERLRASIKREGIRQPVLAASEVEVGRHVLVDGFKRARVARELGLERLDVRSLAIDGPAALALMVRANAAQRGMSALEEGWVVRRLCREHGLTQAKAGALLEREQSWVSLRLRLVEQLEEQLQEDLRLGLLTPSVARELGRLPRAEQIRTAEVVREQGFLSRQATRLVRCLLATDDPIARRSILADPGRFVARAPDEPRPERAQDRRLTAAGNQLRQSVLCFEGAASRLASRLLSHASEELRGEGVRVLSPLLRQARTAGSRAVTLLDEVSGAPRSRPEERASGAKRSDALEQGAVNA